MSAPGVNLTIGPDGTLMMELPHEEGSTRVQLVPGNELKMIYQTLYAQQRGVKRVTGTEACPTQWDVVQEAIANGHQVTHLSHRSGKLAREELTLDDLFGEVT